MKKVLLFIAGLLLLAQLYGQENKKTLASHYFQNQIGYVLDKEGGETFRGINLVNLGWMRYKNKAVHRLEIEGIGFKRNELVFRETDPDFVLGRIERSRRSAEIIYGYSYAFFERLNDFYIGPTTSAFIGHNAITSFSSGLYSENIFCFCAGIGLNVTYDWTVGNNIRIGLSSRFTLLDIGTEITHYDNPILPLEERRSREPHLNFIREQYQLKLSIQFRM